MTELDDARTAAVAAHEVLRAAIHEANLAQHRLSAARRREAGEHEDADYADDRAEYMCGAIIVDYVVGAFYDNLSDRTNYHAVLSTDGECPAHRSHGLASLTARYVAEQ